MTTVEQGGHLPLMRLRAAMTSVGSGSAWVLAHAPAPIRWFLVNPRRLVMVGWLVALLIVGHAEMAYADSVITGPNLAGSAPKTLFESYDPLSYTVTVKPDEQNSDSLEIEQSLLELVGVVDDILLWIGLGLLAGALVLLEWMLNLTIYHDSAPQLDSAVQMIAAQVFWPIIGATAAVGAFMVYARWRSDGRGFASDIAWVVAAVAFAAAFAAGPTSMMNTLDSARESLGNSVIAGAASYVHNQANVTGFPTPPIDTSTQNGATRELVDGLWNDEGATPWCLVEFGSLSVCKVAGYHALADDSTWQGWMNTLDDNGAVPEFGTQGDWIRGQDLTRTGDALILLVLVLPVALFLVRLVLAGLMAAVGVLLMLVIGLVFLAFWPIPGFFRNLGIRYLAYTAGLELQALFVTVTASGVMVVVAVLSAQEAHYQFFVLAILDGCVLFAATKARAWLENFTSGGGASTMGLGGVLMARAAGGAVAKLAGGVLRGGAGLIGGGVRAGMPGARRGGFMTGHAAQNLSPQAARNWASMRDWGKKSGLADLSDDGLKRVWATRVSPSRPALPVGNGRILPAGPGISTTLPGNQAWENSRRFRHERRAIPGPRRVWVSYNRGRRLDTAFTKPVRRRVWASDRIMRIQYPHTQMIPLPGRGSWWRRKP